MLRTMVGLSLSKTDWGGGDIQLFKNVLLEEKCGLHSTLKKIGQWVSC